MIKEKTEGLLIIVSGPSGVGKGTVNGEYLKAHPETYFSVSMTSREQRPSDVDGKTYHFVTKKQFEDEIKKDNFLEYAEYNGNYYGTPKSYVMNNLKEGRDVILEIELQGAMIIKEKMPEAICVFIMPPSLEVLLKRLVSRGTESREKIIKRFRMAYQEINERHKYNYIVINDKVEEAVSKLESIIKAERCRVDRIEDFELGTPEEIIHETLIDDGIILKIK